MPGGKIIYFGPRLGPTRFTIRGVVTAHISTSTGWWIFKKIFQGIKVALNRDQLHLCHEQYGDVYFEGGGSGSIPESIIVYMPIEKLAEFQIQCEVGVTFAQSGPLHQYFRGTEPLAVANVMRTESDTLFENEPLPVQPTLL